jgi:hypothetical protein
MRSGSRRALAVLVAAVRLCRCGLRRLGDAAERHRERCCGRQPSTIGVPRGELIKEARSGQTLAQIATAHEKSVDGLKSAMLAALKARLRRCSLRQEADAGASAGEARDGGRSWSTGS